MSVRSPPDRQRHDHLDIHLLGWFQVVGNGKVVDDRAWRLTKARSLVKLLALSPGHRLHHELIIETLWPGRPLKAARNNLHQT
ncbi:MAG: hypothetical protein ACOC9Y_04300, partial [Chloroflexota bacterium]